MACVCILCCLSKLCSYFWTKPSTENVPPLLISHCKSSSKTSCWGGQAFQSLFAQSQASPHIKVRELSLPQWLLLSDNWEIQNRANIRAPRASMRVVRCGSYSNHVQGPLKQWTDFDSAGTTGGWYEQKACLEEQELSNDYFTARIPCALKVLQLQPCIWLAFCCSYPHHLHTLSLSIKVVTDGSQRRATL